ncbi:unannotated protein [freshwater metagenome]|uniref:Unannotated protein n=1 Tax=freshwater metagenome TaxID=449393 RepID=A0A6J6JI22_9ZZZZ
MNAVVANRDISNVGSKHPTSIRDENHIASGCGGKPISVAVLSARRLLGIFGSKHSPGSGKGNG